MLHRAFTVSCSAVQKGLRYIRQLAETRCPACYSPIVADKSSRDYGPCAHASGHHLGLVAPNQQGERGLSDQQGRPDESGPRACSYGLCSICAAQLSPYTGASCPLCGLPHVDGTGPSVPCARCLASPPLWSAIAFHGLYSHGLQALLLRLKYHADFALIPVLGSMLTACAASLPPYDVLLSMPQYPSHLCARGFNQAHELAKFVALATHMPLAPHMLVRTRQPQSQTRLTAKERWENPKHSFAAHGVHDMRILLIDDTMTTGATLHHATHALLEQGAASVAVAVVARTPPPTM